MLLFRNKHVRDEKIIFNEELHKYRVVDNDIVFTSVTTFIGMKYPLMSTSEIIIKMMNSNKFDESHKYWGMSYDEIFDNWEKLKIESSILGKVLHKTIEEFYNTEFDFSKSKRWLRYAKTYKDSHVSGWDRFIDFLKKGKMYKRDPYRTEWVIYDEDIKIAGTIDIVYMNDDGSLDMYDWKRTKYIPRRTENDNEISNTQYWHYVLQQNLYKYILERKYGMRVRAMHLVQLHPDYDMRIFVVPDVQEKVRLIFEND